MPPDEPGRSFSGLEHLKHTESSRSKRGGKRFLRRTLLSFSKLGLMSANQAKWDLLTDVKGHRDQPDYISAIITTYSPYP